MIKSIWNIYADASSLTAKIPSVNRVADNVDGRPVVKPYLGDEENIRARGLYDDLELLEFVV